MRTVSLECLQLNYRYMGRIKGFTRFITILLAVLIVSACASVTSTAPVVVDAKKRWSLLPFDNLSNTPGAESQLADFVETALRSRGIREIDVYSPDRQVGLRSLFDDSAQQRVARQWARDKNLDYALSGSVHEWQYRSGINKEPTVGLTLRLIDVKTGQVMWQGNAARTGIGYTKLSSVANTLVDQLLSQITVSTSG